MLLLNKDSENKLYIVCDDILTISDPYYLWRFIHEQTQKEYLIQLVNEKEQNRRFDLFTLTLPDDLDLEEGEYYYYVYESDTDGATDYENMNELTGNVLKVVSTFTANETYEPTGEDTTYRG
jgi:hypothetical protein